MPLYPSNQNTLITFKIMHGLSPKYLSDLMRIQQPSSHNLRRKDNGCLLERPNAKTKKTIGDRAFEARSLEYFKTLIKAFLFRKAFQ